MLILAVLPIVVILLGMVVFKKSAVIVSPLTLVFTIILAFIAFKQAPSNLSIQTYKGVVEGLKLIFLIWSAFTMLVMMQKTGAMDKIKLVLAGFTDDKRILVIIIAFCFSIFLEGAAGAGTPSAICAPFLVGLGFTPLAAATAAMVGAGIAPSWGGAGATTIIGVQSVSEHVALADVTAMSGRIAMFGAFIVPIIMIYVMFGKKGFKGLWGYLIYIGLVLAASYFIITNFIATEIVSLGSGAVGMIASIIYIKAVKHTTPEEFKYVPNESDKESNNAKVSSLKAFAPYIILIIALPVIRFSFSMAVLAKYGYVMWIGAVIFATVFLGSIILRSTVYYLSYAKEAVIKVIPALISMASLLAVANIMKSSGMLTLIAEKLSALAGNGYPIVAIAIGSLGTFIAGTGLGSNVMFGSMHMQAAELLGLNKVLIFSCQNVGGAIGNMICPNNIIAVAATVDTLGKEGEIMKKCIPSWLVLVVMYGVLGLLYTHVLFPTFPM